MSDQVATLVERFRIASRELFNHYFAVETAWERQEEAWLMVERFGDVETLLFRKMVSEALGLQDARYGEPQENILVFPKNGAAIQALVNRDVNSGYWDYPVSDIPIDAEMRFIDFFDWDPLSLRDNEYTRVLVVSCASNPRIVGKHALIGARKVSYRTR